MRPQAREETQTLGPGAPVFVCLAVRLRPIAKRTNIWRK
jgi:hypothetical protein